MPSCDFYGRVLALTLRQAALPMWLRVGDAASAKAKAIGAARPVGAPRGNRHHEKSPRVMWKAPLPLIFKFFA